MRVCAEVVLWDAKMGKDMRADVPDAVAVAERLVLAHDGRGAGNY
ncbi:hypothetical protein ACLXNF_19530 [Mycobacteroides chelonae]